MECVSWKNKVLKLKSDQSPCTYVVEIQDARCHAKLKSEQSSTGIDIVWRYKAYSCWSICISCHPLHHDLYDSNKLIRVTNFAVGPSHLAPSLHAFLRLVYFTGQTWGMSNRYRIWNFQVRLCLIRILLFGNKYFSYDSIKVNYLWLYSFNPHVQSI